MSVMHKLGRFNIWRQQIRNKKKDNYKSNTFSSINTKPFFY